MSTVTKWWWRAAVVGATAVGVARFAAATDEPAKWSRSKSPAVVPASAAVPQPPKADPRGPLAPPMLPGIDTPVAPPPPKPLDITPVAPPPMPLPTPSPLAPPLAGGAQPAPPAKSTGSEKPTRPAGLDFNLMPPPGGNTFKTDAPKPPTLPVTPGLPPVTPPTGLIPPVTTPRGDVPGVTVDRPKPADGPFRDSEKFIFPLPTTPELPTPPTTHPGDPTMPSFFKQSALAAMIGGALAVAPTTPVHAFPAPRGQADPTPAELKRALDAATLKIEDTNKKLEDVQATLKRVTDILDGKRDALKSDPGLAAEVKRLTDLVDGKRENGMKIGTDPGVTDEVKRLKDTVHSLQAQIDGMKKTEALRPAAAPADPMAGKGTVSVVNQYPVEISIVVNDKSYRVAPNDKKDIPVAAGEFSYQLLQNGASVVKSTIKEKETVTLRIK